MEQVIGDGLRSRLDARRATEAEAAVHVLNRVQGRPNYVRIVSPQTPVAVLACIPLIPAPRWRAATPRGPARLELASRRG
jgi:hypothetical protein